MGTFYDTQEQAERFTSSWEEEFWARRCGFMNADEYHAATREAFAESVRVWEDE